MKKTFILIAVSCLISVTVFAQKLVSEERTVENFTEIAVSKGVDVTLIGGAKNVGTIRIKSNKEDVIATVTTEVKNGILYISRTKLSDWKINKNLKLMVYVSGDNLKKIEASGGSDIKTQNVLTATEMEVNASGGSDANLNINCERLVVHAKGGSDIDVKGTTNTFECNAGGGSDVSANGFIAKHVVFSISSGSDAKLHATESIKGSASGGSDMKYSGNPAIKEIQSSGGSDVKAR